MTGLAGWDPITKRRTNPPKPAEIIVAPMYVLLPERVTSRFPFDKRPPEEENVNVSDARPLMTPEIVSSAGRQHEGAGL